MSDVMSEDASKDRSFSEQKLALLASLLEGRRRPTRPTPAVLVRLNTHKGGRIETGSILHACRCRWNHSMYRDLARRLGDDQPFYGLQSQGLDGSCLRSPTSKRWPRFM